MFEKNLQWDLQRKTRLEQMRLEKEAKAMNGCTFKPSTSSKSINNASASTQSKTSNMVTKKGLLKQNLGGNSVTNFANQAQTSSSALNEPMIWSKTHRD